MASRAVTAAEVAALAGVSRTAVSFVLNGNAAGNISAPTAARIVAAAQELGYTPNLVAQSLRRRSTRLVGVITDAIATSPFAGRLLAGALDRAAERGFMVSVFESRRQPDREAEAAHELLRRRADGILYAAVSLRVVDDPPDPGLPVVLANCLHPADAWFSVVPDEVAAGRAAADHLTSFGHRRLAMLAGSGPAIAGPLRVAGFRAGLQAAGVAHSDTEVVTAGWTIDAGYAAACAVLDGPAPPTAVFAVNDRVAFGALLAAARRGLSVPNDLSIIGFDDQEELAANVVPALTTVALPHREMGEVAMDALLTALEDGTGAPAPRRELLSCPVVERSSVGPPADLRR